VELDALAERQQQRQSQQHEKQQHLNSPALQPGKSNASRRPKAAQVVAAPAAGASSSSGSRWSEYMPGEGPAAGPARKAAPSASPLPPPPWGFAGYAHGSLLSAAPQALGPTPMVKPVAKPAPVHNKGSSTTHSTGVNSTATTVKVAGPFKAAQDDNGSAATDAQGSHETPADQSSMPATEALGLGRAPAPQPCSTRPPQIEAPRPVAAHAPVRQAGGVHHEHSMSQAFGHAEDDGDDDDPFTQLLATQGSRLPAKPRTTQPPATAALPAAQAEATPTGAPSHAVPAAASSQQVTSLFDLFT
jgi:hypothetical protein